MAYDCLKCKECASMIACPYCDDGSEFVRMSNAEYIRMMSDEELAKFLERFGTFNQPCSLTAGEPLKWLQSEIEE